MFSDYLKQNYGDRLQGILSSSDTTMHHSINIRFTELFEADPHLANELINSPNFAIEHLYEQLHNVLNEMKDTLCKGETNRDKIHLRIYDLHFCSELNRYEFPKNIERGYLQFSGTITRISAVKLLKFKRDFVCRKCGEIVTVTASYEQKYCIIAPKKCPRDTCNGKQMNELKDLQSSYCKDYQEVKMQEDLSLLDSGIIPHSMVVTLEDDLADICKPGDSVTVCGVIKRRWDPFVKNKPINVTLALQAHHVSINNVIEADELGSGTDFALFWHEHRKRGEELRGRDVVLQSFSPEIHGLYLIKLAVAVVLAGGGGRGDENTSNSGSNEGVGKTRVQPHLLLVGDPGTGKSQLLRHASRIIPRSVCTTGIGSTSAGLTVTAIMEDGEWQLEAGALVLSDGGICCIDEFHTMRGHDRTSIHEAMEQQSISVAKASIVCKLYARCSILAAANPQGPLDGSQPLCCNLPLASPLLSRFDLILSLKDTVDQIRDERVADFILSRYQSNPVADDKQIWSLDTLKDYYLEIRKRNPLLNPKVTPVLNAYYQYRRRRKFRNEARTTVRLLDSLVRLSKAHAKLMFRNEVTMTDAVMAIALLEASVEMDTLDLGGMFDTQMDFPADPEQWYRRVEEIIFSKLQNYMPQSSCNEELMSTINIHHCTTRLEVINPEFTCSTVKNVSLNVTPSTNLLQTTEREPFEEVTSELKEVDLTLPYSEVAEEMITDQELIKSQNLRQLPASEVEENASFAFLVSQSKTLPLPSQAPLTSLVESYATNEPETCSLDVQPATATYSNAIATNGKKMSLKQRFGYLARVTSVQGNVNEVTQTTSTAEENLAGNQAYHTSDTKGTNSRRNVSDANDTCNVSNTSGVYDMNTDIKTSHVTTNIFTGVDEELEDTDFDF